MTIPVFTIMPDVGGRYAWQNSSEEAPWSLLGRNCADESGWYAAPPISENLHQAFARWQAEFEQLGWCTKVELEWFDWVDYHSRGIVLAHRLKNEFGDAAVVIYEKASEDPCHRDAERREILPNGQVRILPSRKRQEQMAVE